MCSLGCWGLGASAACSSHGWHTFAHLLNSARQVCHYLLFPTCFSPNCCCSQAIEYVAQHFAAVVAADLSGFCDLSTACLAQVLCSESLVRFWGRAGEQECELLVPACVSAAHTGGQNSSALLLMLL